MDLEDGLEENGGWVVLEIYLGFPQANSGVLIWTTGIRNTDKETRLYGYTGKEQWKPCLNPVNLTATLKSNRKQSLNCFLLENHPKNLIRCLHHRNPLMGIPATHFWQVSLQHLLFHQKPTLRKHLGRTVLLPVLKTCTEGGGGGVGWVVSAVPGRPSQADLWGSLACHLTESVPSRSQQVTMSHVSKRKVYDS